MTDRTPNLADVVAEVRALFERYEQALADKDVEVLDATFWNSPHTIRYALHENGYGFDEIHRQRLARPPGPGIKEKRIRLEILTLGRDLAMVKVEGSWKASATAEDHAVLRATPRFDSRTKVTRCWISGQ